MSIDLAMGTSDWVGFGMILVLVALQVLSDWLNRKLYKAFVERTSTALDKLDRHERAYNDMLSALNKACETHECGACGAVLRGPSKDADGTVHR